MPESDASRDAPDATAIALPADSGSVAFEVPAGFGSGRDLFLIVSASATGGPYPVRCSGSAPVPDERLPSLESIGSVVEVDNQLRHRSNVAAPSGRIEPEDASPISPGHRPPLRRTFAVMVRPGDPTAPSNYDLVDARLRALGERIQVFVDEADVPEVADETLRGLVAGFDQTIAPTLSASIGSPMDVDRDGRLTVLLSHRIGLPFNGHCQVDGYFRSADLDLELPRPLSNRADLVYLNARLQPGPYLETILAHEYAHLVLESRRRERIGPVPEASWIDEGLAHLCEARVGRSASNVDYRVGAFLADPGRYRLVIDHEHRSGRFRSHGSRGAAALFFLWCAETFDPELPRSLSNSGAVGLRNLERVTGRSFDELYRRWTIALALESLDRQAGAFGTLDLLDGLGEWPTGGVRFDPIEPDSAPFSGTIEGSSSRFFRVSTLPDGPTRVEVSANPASGLRVTALLVSPEVPRLSLDLSVIEQNAEGLMIVAQATEPTGRAMRLDRLSWEPVRPARDRPREAIQAHRFPASRVFPDPTLPPRSERRSEPFSIPSDWFESGPLIVRLSARTEDGTRIVSWSELPPPPTHSPTRRSTLASRRDPPEPPRRDVLSSP